jgi:hypothetical protein
MEQQPMKVKKRKPIFLVLCALAVTLAPGCEDGLRAGVNDGLSAALSAVIQAPVNYVLDQAFNEP